MHYIYDTYCNSFPNTYSNIDTNTSGAKRSTIIYVIPPYKENFNTNNIHDVINSNIERVAT